MNSSLGVTKIAMDAFPARSTPCIQYFLICISFSFISKCFFFLLFSGLNFWVFFVCFGLVFFFKLFISCFLFCDFFLFIIHALCVFFHYRIPLFPFFSFLFLFLAFFYIICFNTQWEHSFKSTIQALVYLVFDERLGCSNVMCVLEA